MAPKKGSTLERPVGIFIYTSEEEKARVKRAAKADGRTITEYCRRAILKQVESDEIPTG